MENAKRFEPIDEEDVEMVTPLEEPIEELKPIEEDIEFEGNQLLSAEEYDSYLNADINKNNVSIKRSTPKTFFFIRAKKQIKFQNYSINYDL